MSLKPNPFQTIYIRDDIGVSKKYQRNPETNELEDITTRSRQYDNQLSPISILVCEHHCKPIMLCHNTIEKRRMQYEFNYDNDRLEEIRCDKCIDKGNQLKPGDLMFVVSPPKIDDVVKFFVGEDGRIEKKKWLEECQEFMVLPSTEIKNADKKVTLDYTLIPILDNSIRPFYSENSPTLNNIRVIVGQNLITGDLGKYVFDPCSHAIFQIEVEDVEYDLDAIRKDLAEGGKKILMLSMSALTQKAVAVLRKDDLILEKRHLNPDGSSAVVDPMMVVVSEHRVRQMKEEWKKKELVCWKETNIADFYKLIADYMVINMDGQYRGEVLNVHRDVLTDEMAGLKLKDALKMAPEDPETSKDSESLASEDFERINRDSQASDRSEDDDSYDIVTIDELNQ